MPTRHIALVLALAAALLTPARLEAQSPIFATLAGSATAEMELEAEPAPEPLPEAAPEHDALGADMRDGRITRGFIDHRVLHFTFDDGPRPSTTNRLLDHLDHYGVHATFFVVARQLEGRRRAPQRAVVQEIARRGHTVGMHTWNHSNLTTLTDAQIREQLTRTETIFESVLGGRPWVMRPPYGARDARVDAILVERSYTPVLWNLTARDTSSRRPEEVLEAFRASLDASERHPRGPGGIVLLHDTHDWVVDAFPLMMEELEARNCAILEHGTDEELWDVADDLRMFHQPRAERRAEHASTVHLADELVQARQVELRARTEERCR